jgi:hypothetical protein
MPWAYVAKFGFQTGEDSTISGSVMGLLATDVSSGRVIPPTHGEPKKVEENGEIYASLEDISEPEILLYCDEEWPIAADFRNGDNELYVPADGVVDRGRSPEMECNARADLARDRIKLRVAADGTAVFEQKLSQYMRPHVWFVVLADCKRLSTEAQEIGAVHKDFEVTVTFTQPDGSHLPCDERWMPSLYLLCTAGVVGFSVYFLKTLAHHHAATGEIHPVTAALGLVLSLQLASLMLEQIHLWRLLSSGSGISMFDGLSHLCSLLGTGTMTVLLILISYGWTITSGSLHTVAFSGLAGLGPGGALLGVYGAKCLLLAASWAGLLHSPDDGHAIYHDFETCE